ncbi:hypothetical protein AB0F46_42680 [Streptomyces sp. NPDC026665]|uniref:hypothetical protein n=1 Tax=Streptomyces sp. NPDC026665 TaxID=3154798 RepID=UPI00340AAA37
MPKYPPNRLPLSVPQTYFELRRAFADTAAADSTAFCSVTFSLVIDASSMIGSYTERFTVPASTRESL